MLVLSKMRFEEIFKKLKLKEHTLYRVLVKYSPGNPKHIAFLFVGFESGGYCKIYTNSYEDVNDIGKVYAIEVLQELCPIKDYLDDEETMPITSAKEDEDFDKEFDKSLNDFSSKQKCSFCQGEGYLSEHNDLSRDSETGEHDCSGCPIQVPCYYCDGTGKIINIQIQGRIERNHVQPIYDEAGDPRLMSPEQRKNVVEIYNSMKIHNYDIDEAMEGRPFDEDEEMFRSDVDALLPGLEDVLP